MIRRIFSTIVLLFMMSAGAIGQGGIVGVYTDLGARGGQGTGFLTSPSGEVITAYHVIHGARRIDIVWRGFQERDVVIAKILPDADLAILRLERVPAGLKPLPIPQKVGHWTPGQTVQVIGYARGIPDQRFDGTVTQEGTWTSEQIRDDAGRRLFAREGLQLIPLDLTIYSGLSGSPILRGGEVIGVLSGSLSSGRGIAWGMPLSYLSSMQTIERRASGMDKWPPFAMTKDWATLRSAFRIDNERARLLDEYFAAVDDLVRSYDDLQIEAEAAQGAIFAALRVQGAEISDAEIDLLVPKIVTAGQGFFHSSQVEARIHNALGKMLGQVDDVYTGLPRTVLNLKNAKDIAQKKEQIKRHRVAQSDYDNLMLPACAESLRLLRQLASIDPQKDRSNWKAVFLQAVSGYRGCLDAWLGLSGIRARNETIQMYRDIGELFQIMLYHAQELDLTSEPQRYTAKGYSVVLPSGWIPLTAELATYFRPGSLKSKPGAELSFIRTGFFNDKRDYFDTIALTSYASPGAVTDEVLQATKASTQNRPGFRDVSVERATFGQNAGILIRSTFGPELQPRRMLVSLIGGRVLMVEVDCYLGPLTSSNECQSVVNSLRFE